jgi:general stress protein YciG
MLQARKSRCFASKEPRRPLVDERRGPQDLERDDPRRLVLLRFVHDPGSAVADDAADLAGAKRGFAAMPAERRRAIARKGGKSVPAGKRLFSARRDIARAKRMARELKESGR